MSSTSSRAPFTAVWGGDSADEPGVVAPLVGMLCAAGMSSGAGCGRAGAGELGADVGGRDAVSVPGVSSTAADGFGDPGGREPWVWTAWPSGSETLMAGWPLAPPSAACAPASLSGPDGAEWPFVSALRESPDASGFEGSRSLRFAFLDAEEVLLPIGWA
jgi:hypothetical protein